MCIHKVVGRSLVYTTVFPANVSIRQKDVFLRDTYVCTYSDIPLPYSDYVTLQIAWGQLQRYGRATWGDQLNGYTRKFDPVDNT